MNNKNEIIAVVLAAGKSARMGANKLSLPLGTCSVGGLSIQKALQTSVKHTIVVTREGDRLYWIAPSMFEPTLYGQWSQAECPNSSKGQANSLLYGLNAALKRKPKGILVLLADQPFISVSTINDLCSKYEKHCQDDPYKWFVAARFQGIPRPPIIFSPRAVPDLLRLQGDEGARRLLQKYSAKGLFIDYNDASDFFDIDTAEDYEAMKGLG
ncbi:nucleotidyltransferase family protein [Mesobacillus harenae]|uniref:nucleotidyltransferase family protein n=1 Tax=Mesobacillus harenae TaxID=2213203 RepID=UPI00158010CE|nr:nucleotidyltransferase family protein [Mesobacillus harenae]